MKIFHEAKGMKESDKEPRISDNTQTEKKEDIQPLSQNTKEEENSSGSDQE